MLRRRARRSAPRRFRPVARRIGIRARGGSVGFLRRVGKPGEEGVLEVVVDPEGIRASARGGRGRFEGQACFVHGWRLPRSAFPVARRRSGGAGHSRPGDAVLPDEAVEETGREDELVRGRADEGFRPVGANRSPADGARDEPPDMGVAAYEVIVAGVHEEEARRRLARPPGEWPRPPPAGGTARPEVSPPRCCEAPGGTEEVFRLPSRRRRRAGGGSEELARHCVHAELVEVAEQVFQGLLLARGGQLPPLRPACRETETTAVPVGRFRPFRAPGPGTQDRIDERDGEVGGEELVREPRLGKGQGSANRVGHQADVRFCFWHVVHL